MADLLHLVLLKRYKRKNIKMKNIGNKTYTIIIPHHNNITLLERGIDSIPRREDIQVIVVDDASTNVNERDWENFKKKYPHVDLILNQENRGPGYARNCALDGSVKGKWLLFMDADDTYTDNAFAVLDKYVDSEYDLIFLNANRVYLDGRIEKYDRLNRLISNAINNSEKLDNLKYLLTAPWNKMVRASLVQDNHIRFDNSFYGEDVIYSIILGYIAKKIFIEQKALYNYTYSENGLARTFDGRNFTWCKKDFTRRIAYHKFLNYSGHQDWERNILINNLMIIRSVQIESGIKQALISLLALFYVMINPFIEKNYIVNKIKNISYK